LKSFIPCSYCLRFSFCFQLYLFYACALHFGQQNQESCATVYTVPGVFSLIKSECYKNTISKRHLTQSSRTNNSTGRVTIVGVQQSWRLPSNNAPRRVNECLTVFRLMLSRRRAYHSALRASDPFSTFFYILLLVEAQPESLFRRSSHCNGGVQLVHPRRRRRWFATAVHRGESRRLMHVRT